MRRLSKLTLQPGKSSHSDRPRVHIGGGEPIGIAVAGHPGLRAPADGKGLGLRHERREALGAGRIVAAECEENAKEEDEAEDTAAIHAARRRRW